MSSFNPMLLPFTRPSPYVKALDLPDVPESIIEGMAKYEDAARVFNTEGFEMDYVDASGRHVPGGIIVQHCPAGANATQVYRMPRDPRSEELERLSFFNFGEGNRIHLIVPLAGDDWRGVWRPGGWILVMDPNIKKSPQLWRYWEDRVMKDPLPRIDGEPDNNPGPGRFERLTHDEYRHQHVKISRSQKVMVFMSNRENGADSLVHLTYLKNSNTGAQANSAPFTLPSRLVTPLRETKERDRWVPQDISADDSRLLVISELSTSYKPLYVADLTANPPRTPERIIIDQFVGPEQESSIYTARFSPDADTPDLIYLITDGFGDFRSLVAYDLGTKTALHITTAEPEFAALRPIPWDALMMKVTDKALYFVGNLDGWRVLHVVPLTGKHKHQVIEVRLKGWVGGGVIPYPNGLNNNSMELVVQLTSHRTKASLAYVDLKPALLAVHIDIKGEKYVEADWAPYVQAQAAEPAFPTPVPKLLRFSSFDNLEVPAIYYRPEGRQGPLPLLIHIHEGPTAPATPFTTMPIHGYLLNELGCAMMYPNPRGRAGFGKRYLIADDGEKREDSIKDIEALVDYIKENMKDEIRSDKIAVHGASYSGYMALACLTNFPDKLACGIVSYGITHLPSFLQNSAAFRRDFRRREYGDERDPNVLEFLERISPRNNASRISVPLQIAHGETDVKVPVEEVYRLHDVLTRNGVLCELMVCENEGHGFKRKSVIDFVYAAKIHFIQRHLCGSTSDL